MRIINILSVLGVIAASFFAYGYFYLGGTGTSYYPVTITILMLSVFTLSYLLSLFDVKTSVSKIFALTVTFAGFVAAVMFSILVMLGKSIYPSIFGISGAYVEAVLLLLLMIQWNRQR
jgi:hypothetical protein